jgi:hypothetical protein
MAHKGLPFAIYENIILLHPNGSRNAIPRHFTSYNHQGHNENAISRSLWDTPQAARMQVPGIIPIF